MQNTHVELVCADEITIASFNCLFLTETRVLYFLHGVCGVCVCVYVCIISFNQSFIESMRLLVN